MSIVRFTPIATPAAAPTGKVQVFVDSADGDLKQINDAGTVTPLGLSFTPENVVNKSTTTALGTSDTLYPTQKAVKTYVDAAISGLASVYQALLGYTPENVANKSDTTTLGVSTTLYPTQHAVKTYVDNAITALASVYQTLLGYTPENVANKDTTVTLGSSNTLYPSQLAVKTYVDSNHPNTDGDWARIAAGLGSGIFAAALGMKPDDGTTTSGMGSASVGFAAIAIREARTITNIHWYQGGAGVYTGDAYNGVGLYSYSAGTLTLLSSSANDANCWKGSAGTLQTKALAAPQTVTPGVYFIAWLYHNSAQTTAPTLLTAPGRFSSAQSTLNYTNSAKDLGFVTGQTALPTPQAISGVSSNQTFMPVFMVS